VVDRVTLERDFVRILRICTLISIDDDDDDDDDIYLTADELSPGART